MLPIIIIGIAALQLDKEDISREGRARREMNTSGAGLLGSLLFWILISIISCSLDENPFPGQWSYTSNQWKTKYRDSDSYFLSFLVMLLPSKALDFGLIMSSQALVYHTDPQFNHLKSFFFFTKKKSYVVIYWRNVLCRNMLLHNLLGFFGPKTEFSAHRKETKSWNLNDAVHMHEIFLKTHPTATSSASASATVRVFPPCLFSSRAALLRFRSKSALRR